MSSKGLKPAKELARLVLDKKPTSYVESATALANFVIELPEEDSTMSDEVDSETKETAKTPVVKIDMAIDDKLVEEPRTPEPDSGNPIRRLFGSSKAIVVMAITAVSFLAVYQGKAQFHEVTDFLKLIVGPWLLAQGLEDAAKHYKRS